MVRLVDLEAAWVGAGGEGITLNGVPVPERHGVGLAFNCPCGCGERCYIAFANPLDGGPPHVNVDEPTWTRTGETIETLSLQPSILRRNTPEWPTCGWHGYVTNGIALPA